MRPRVDRAPCAQARRFPRRQLDTQHGGERLRQLRMQRENIAPVALVPACPDVSVRPGVDELGAHPHPIAVGADAAFEQKIDTQLSADFADLFPCSFVAHHGGARTECELVRGQLSQLGNQLLGEPVAEALLLRTAAEVQKGQHRQPDPGPRCSRPSVVLPAARGPPGIDLGGERIHRGKPLVQVAVDGQTFFLLPPAHGSHAALEVGGDPLPGLQTPFRTGRGRRGGRLPRNIGHGHTEKGRFAARL